MMEDETFIYAPSDTNTYQKGDMMGSEENKQVAKQPSEWRVVLVFKRFGEGKEPKVFEVLENNGDIFLSVQKGRDRTVIKLSSGEVAELATKLLGVAMRW